MNLQSNKGSQVIKKKRIFCYARVSTDQQNSGLESQCRTLSEYCRLNNIVDFELFTDENQSGAKSSRPALDRMMALVCAGEVDKVIVYSLSRLGRSTTHLLKLMDELSTHDVKFVSLSERIETETPAGRMIFTVLAAVSQLERELIVERVKNWILSASFGFQKTMKDVYLRVVARIYQLRVEKLNCRLILRS